jgi:dihydroorotate dehydrogenase (NAD+) catalytic subunit
VSAGALEVEAAGLRFQNPLLLASGTAAYGRELDGVIDVDALGGIVTKAVSVRPRAGAPPVRVADFPGGMINAVGLANPGLEAVRRDELPWLAAHCERARTLVNVVGDTVEEYGEVVRGLTDASGVHGFELNVSCPNVKAGGMEFGADPQTLAAVVRSARAVTTRPLFVKLSPVLPDIGASARIAVDAGADGISVVNTIPGLVVDVAARRPALGFGTGGVSGPAILPVGVLATWRVRRAVQVPILGVGGVANGSDALQYIMAGASLVGIGTAALRDPRAPMRVVKEMSAWCDAHGVTRISDLVGTLEGLT